MVRTTRFVAPVFGLRREIDKLFADAFGVVDEPRPGVSAWLPSVDVKETADALYFELELPGVTEDKIEITSESGVLVIAGEKTSVTQEGDDGKFHIVERTFGAFRRAFHLPANAQDDKISATLTNGVLRVRVPKAEVPKARRVEVRTA